MATNKRNWNDIANQYADVLAGAHNANAHPKNTNAAKKSCYNIGKNDIVVKTMNRYLHAKFYNSNVKGNKKSYYIRNHVTGKDIRVCQDHDFSIGSLEDTFNDVGHCLAYKIYDSYVTKVMFDLDCYLCKNNSCNNTVEYEIVQLIHDAILKCVKDELKSSGAQCVVFKKPSCCNLHIYFNVSVSLCVLELLRKRLQSSLDEDITNKYNIDNVYMLDLPFSTKDGNSIYKFIYQTPGANYKKFSCFPVDSSFYDIGYKLSVDEVYDSHVTLGSFKTTHTSEWNDDVDYVKYLLTPIEFKPRLVKHENSLITNIKISNIKNFQTSYVLLEHYFKPLEDNASQVFIDESYLEELNSREKKMYKNIVDLGSTLGKKIYHGVCNMYNVFRFIMMNDGNYAFYVICAMIFHFHKVNPTMSLQDCKVLTLRVLNAVIEKKNEVLVHILQCFDQYDCISNLEPVFVDSDKWFSYLISVAKMETFSDCKIHEKQMRLITMQLKIYESMDAVHAELVDLCKMLLPIVKIEHAYGKVYYYINEGVYISITMDKFFNSHTPSVQVVEKLMKDTLQVFVSNNQLSPDLAGKVVLKDVWMRYLTCLPVKNPSFNFYNYFISTECGVFNTITGLYMAHTPMLYMNTQKSYCRVPMKVLTNFKDLSMIELNSHIMKEDQDQLYSNVLDVLLSEQKKLFYGSIMIPGLLKLRDTLFEPEQEDNVLNLIFETIIEDENEDNEKLLYFTEPLINLYGLNVSVLLQLSTVIQKNISDLGVFTRESVLRYCQVNSIKFKSSTEFVQSDHLTLFDQLTKEHVTQFKAKFFTLAIVLCVFESAHLMNRKFSDVFSLNVKDQVKISKYHMFHDIAQYSLSMYSDDNTRRVLEYLINNDSMPKTLLNFVSTVSTMMNYNSTTINDFLLTFSMIYNHNSKRKKLALLIGSPNSGKSTYQIMLSDIHGRSNCSVTSFFQSESQGPAPEIVNALTKYYFSISEFRSMTAATMKSLISGDITHKRLCHQNDMIELKPLPFAVAAANVLPSVFQADEAIRDRLAPFLFKNIFLDEKLLRRQMDDNTLLACVSNYMVTTTNFQVFGISKEFSNVLYEYYRNHRDKYGLLQATISKNNANSQLLISQILIKNNIIYSMLYISGVVFDDDLFITYEELQEILTSEIEKYNETTKHKRYNWNVVKNELSLLFKHKETADESGIRGMGLKNSNLDYKSVVNFSEFIVKEEGKSVTWTYIKSYLFHVKKFKFDHIRNLFEIFKLKYKGYWNDSTSELKDHRLLSGS